MYRNPGRSVEVSGWLLAALVGCSASGPSGKKDMFADGSDSISDVDVDASDHASGDEAVGELPQEELDAQQFGELAEVQPDQASETAGESDTTQCQDSKPTEGCPCTQEDFSCCTKIAQGLTCRVHFGDDKPLKWALFHDCGCWAIPQCQEWPSYDLCPGYQP